MNIIYFLICCSVPIALGFLIAFLRSNKAGQFEDLETPAMRILFEEEENKESNQTP
jgi:cbb3-type cytochrome oxidase maturation protein